MKKNIKYQEVLIEIKPSKILTGEIGMFACRAFPKGTIVAKSSVFKAKLFPWKEITKDNFSEVTLNKIKAFCLGTDKGIFIPKDLNLLSIPWNMNHSCNGNVGFNSNNDFIAIRDVKNCEELCWDYGLGESNPNFSMDCFCGEKKCRKIISGNDWKELKNTTMNKYMISYLKK